MPKNLGWIDSNVFVHALTRDAHSDRCNEIIDQLEDGRSEAWIDPTVLHELSYVLPRIFKWSRAEAGEHLLLILAANGIRTLGDVNTLQAAVGIWMASNVGFVDALLVARGNNDGAGVCTINSSDVLTVGGKGTAPPLARGRR